ncbi:hypothetical protein BDV29DRAFT_185253 [Aspergillus leporis]|uniref:Uncharacterized protein n=1 Tax=Aspergillus leporis TaxID=41062 RepID=A0A5N5WHT0_9EURO|nr:hypothetical protein BDV29DRAFT_185253 [Aspergillus leporis]
MPCSALTLLLHASWFGTQPNANSHPSQVLGQAVGFTQHYPQFAISRKFEHRSDGEILFLKFQHDSMPGRS